ncbi:hypothetical protein VTK26DRAFT_6172 [Humicola hyalothermophila]
MSERKSHEDSLAGRRRAKKGSQEDEKWDITPDGGSAGREGRKFTVANVGNNGRIYLRPTIRPANQRYPQPNFVFPMTPPHTAGLEPLSPEQPQDSEPTAPTPGRRCSPLYPPSSSTSLAHDSLGEKHIKIRQRHRRAMSDSTIPDTSVARESEPGGLKIVITKPGEDQRPRTVETMDTGRPPFLEVAIPSWRIGSPRFSIRGTPFIRGSSCAPTEELHSSGASFLNHTPQDASPRASRRPSFFPVPGWRSSSADPSMLLSPSSSRLASQSRLGFQSRPTYVSTHLVIEPAMFDDLTFKPACDDRTIVRYSASGAVTAATPPRLVAEITSPSFLDYELLSDFFLTYRSFLEPIDLLRMLFARLRWALARTDEAGMVVRVRTFVAMRHWILNYFIDDFLMDHHLRVTFCSLVNEFVEDLSHDLKARKVPFKILTELKKCWRRVCAQFWDGPYFDPSLGPDIPISPGGLPGDRDPRLDPTSQTEADPGPPKLDDLPVPITYGEHTSLYIEMAKAGHIDAVVAGDRPATPENADAPEKDVFDRRNAASPTSVASVDVISCSFPTKNLRSTQPGTRYPAAHPVDPSAIHNTEPVATTPRTLVGKRARPHPSHKRNGSLSDSLREHPTMTEKALYRNAELLLAVPYAGSLVRGDLLPPSQSFVEVCPSGPSARQTTLFQSTPVGLAKENPVASAMSGQGMKRLLGSVRRALSTRGQSIPSSSQGADIDISPLGPKGATTNRVPGTAIVPQGRPRQNGTRPPVRIDLLGAGVAEDFKRAVREDSAAGTEQRASGSQAPADAPGCADASTSPPHFAFSGDNEEPRPICDMEITNGSQSIVIVDDTLLSADYPAMTGAPLAVNPSVEAFAETFVPKGADPTPPNTPPGRPTGTPRRSSYILGRHVLQHPLSEEPLPSSAHDRDAGKLAYQSDSSPYHNIPVDPAREDAQQPPPVSAEGHTKQSEGQSYISVRSKGHTRNDSSLSATFPQSTVRSFDATTLSGQSMDGSPPVLVPQPHRVLRRKPGGNLRAVAKVGDLDPSALRRSHSVGSLTTYTESLGSSSLRSPIADSGGYVNVVPSDCSPGRAEVFSVGALAEQNPKRHVSLFSTHSSKPVMRPSFEAEAQKLAQIPDDADDDGGVEAALLKLEGKYQKKTVPKLSMDLSVPPGLTASLGVRPEIAEKNPVTTEEKKEHRHVHLVDDPCLPSASAVPTADDQHQRDFLDVACRNDVQSFLSDDSRASYCSIPLLDRGLTDEARSKRTLTAEWTDRSVLQDPDEAAFDSQHPSYDFVSKTHSMDQVEPEAPTVEAERASLEQSFLDVASDDDDNDDLSTELSSEAPDQDEENGELTPSKIGIALTTSPVPPAENESAAVRPPTPPMTFLQALHIAPETAHVPALQDLQVWEKPLPPTPDTTTTGAPYTQQGLASPTDPTCTKEALGNNTPKIEVADPASEPVDASRNKLSVHLPFILAFDSEILAQQFTLVEKDALNEIDWKELIDMRWKHAEQNGINVRSWVSFLRDTDARGVEVVIARFNIMVKWAVSEIVLTQDVEERARCIIKFIHIAAHCRRYRNFATMAQITIALTSNEVARLAKTWALVPASDARTLQELETLMSPTRNFYNLRAEMEGGGGAAGTAAEMGCIPFVGIYTHDLLFNAQKPSEIASSPTTAPLVNFERCRTAAGVVKTLLRLLEASTLYSFQPIEGVTERCLWMGALEDDEIRRCGERLE